jgi:hypothetical protein
MSSTSGAGLIIDHLGGEQFLVSLGARDFAIDETHVGFTLVHSNPKNVHSVTITIEANGGFKVLCYGQLSPRTFSAPVLATENVAIPDNLAEVLGKLTGITALQNRHL